MTRLDGVEVGPPAHGGACVARVDGRVVFVRHALPGEVVDVEVTDTSHDRFWRGDAVAVHRPAPGRVEPRCAIAGPGGCGGCDLQHADTATQLEWKRAVVAEQLARLADWEWGGVVESVEPRWHWRTRMAWSRTPEGRRGLKRARSHEVIALPGEGCAIAASDAIDPGTARGEVTERAAGRDFVVGADGFFQVHPRAGDVLVAAVMDGLAPRPGESAFDLYGGVGLFAGALVDAGCAPVTLVEAHRDAVTRARRNVPEARCLAQRVDRALTGRLPARVDLVVLDPPRAGAGKDVMRAVLQRSPRAVAHVACDPASLGRDLGVARRAGWEIASVRAFDLFPQTQHVECVAILRPPS